MNFLNISVLIFYDLKDDPQKWHFFPTHISKQKKGYQSKRTNEFFTCYLH